MKCAFICIVGEGSEMRVCDKTYFKIMFLIKSMVEKMSEGMNELEIHIAAS